MPDLLPFVLDPVIVPKPWGGRRLARYGKRLPPSTAVGESWDVADLPAEAVTSAGRSRSLVAAGPWEGMPLRHLIAQLGRDLMGNAAPTAAGDFPLLFKFLDAAQHLSVQVHPTADYVATHPEAHLKTESWYIVHAAPDSVIFKGLRPGVTMEDVQSTAGTAAFVDLLQRVPAIPGAFHHMPAGIVHALGAGVLVAEPQTPSDTTFRLYDWTEEYGREPRELHLVEALETLLLDPADATGLPPLDGPAERLLVTTDDYWMRELRTAGGAIALRSGAELRMIAVVAGDAAISGPGSSTVELTTGTTAIVPAAIATDVQVTATGEATILEIGLA